VARLIGMTEESIDALVPGSHQALFSAQEQAVLAFVDEVISDGGASEETFAQVSEFMSSAEIMELTVVIGVYTMVSQICATFEIEPEEVPIADTGLEDIKRTVDKLG
jgi:alkylhydroperoxidase family enzyme